MNEFKNPVNRLKNTILFFGRRNCNYSENAAKLIRQYDFNLYDFYSNDKSDSVPKKAYDLEIDYIICFRSWLILPESILKKVKKFSINFHPGPPAYPGSGCVNFSIYNQEEKYGVTIHLMEKKVDSGKIIDYELFPVSSDQILLEVLEQTHLKLFRSFQNFIKNFKKEGDNYILRKLQENENVKWSQKKRKVSDLEFHREIAAEISEEDLNRRIKAFHHPNFPLFIKLYGKKFYLK